MNQEQAHRIIDELLIATQKTRSNLLETMGDDTLGKSMLGFMYPSLFDNDYQIKTIDAIYKYSMKEELEPIDMYNAINLAQKEPAVRLVYCLLWGKDYPDAKQIMLSMM